MKKPIPRRISSKAMTFGNSELQELFSANYELVSNTQVIQLNQRAGITSYKYVAIICLYIRTLLIRNSIKINNQQKFFLVK